MYIVQTRVIFIIWADLPEISTWLGCSVGDRYSTEDGISEAVITFILAVQRNLPHSFLTFDLVDL